MWLAMESVLRCLNLQRKEEMIRKRERHLQGLLEHSHEVGVLLDFDGTIRYVTPSVKNISGYGPSELVGRNGLELVHPEDISIGIRLLFAPPGEAADKAESLRLLFGDGKWHTVKMTGRNLLKDPDVAGILVNFGGISERPGIEKNLERLQKVVLNLDKDPDLNIRTLLQTARDILRLDEIIYASRDEEGSMRIEGSDGSLFKSRTGPIPRLMRELLEAEGDREARVIQIDPCSDPGLPSSALRSDSMAVVPVVLDQDRIGFLGCFQSGSGYSAGDFAILSIVALALSNQE